MSSNCSCFHIIIQFLFISFENFTKKIFSARYFWGPKTSLFSPHCCGVRHISSSDSSCDVSWLLHFLIFQLTCGDWRLCVWSSPKRVPHQKSYFRTVCRTFLPYLTGNTLWKFHDFSITQILCEINFWDSRSAKSVIFSHLKALNCDFN